jgi:hypothetical protein
MLVDVTAYQQEQARCGMDTETGRAVRGPAHHGTLLHHRTRRHRRAGAPADASAAPLTLWDELNVC